MLKIETNYKLTFICRCVIKRPLVTGRWILLMEKTEGTACIYLELIKMKVHALTAHVMLFIVTQRSLLVVNEQRNILYYVKKCQCVKSNVLV